MQTPSGYESGTIAGAKYIVRQGLAPLVRDAIDAAGSLDAFAAANAVESLRGRGATHVIDAQGDRLVVRHFRRGGAVASMLGDRYVRVGQARPFRELAVSEIARARGVRTPAVAAAVVYPAGPFYRGDIATDFVPDAMTLADLTFGEVRAGDDERLGAWNAAGRLLRDAARAGLVHPDLNLRNVLIAWRAGQPIAHLIDLDRCRIADRVSPDQLDRMRSRFVRSAHKIAAGRPFDDELAAFEEGVRG